MMRPTELSSDFKKPAQSSRTSRRRFCGNAALTLAALLSTRCSFARDDNKRSAVLLAPNFGDADRYLAQQPVTVTAFSSPRSAGGKHDYFSEGDYWWPDPKDPNGPYIQRDGMSNPENFTQHRHALIQLGIQVPTLTVAWHAKRDRRYSDHAARHLRAWFLDPATMMNPNLQFAQAIHGRSTGRGIGIIDTIHLVEVVQSIPFLVQAGALSKADQQGLKNWFSEYLNWLTSSKNGQEERDAKNNHGTCWVMQAAQFAKYVENREVTDFCRDRFENVIVPHQIAADGSFPEELRRTKPYNYSLFNLDIMSVVCQILSDKDVNLFAYTLPDGRGYSKAVAFMFPYIRNKRSWPYKPDVEYFQYWPISQPSLLFAGLALHKKEYIDAWGELRPEPDVEEIIRNNPVRQPLLWLRR
jgi:hypothetical protein